MQKYLLLLLVGSIFSFNLASAQPVSVPPSMPPPVRGLGVSDLGEYVFVKATNSLTKFDLDFPGGTPKDLVKAVGKAIGKPLNAVIPDEYASLKISAISVRNVTLTQLFETLKQISKKTERYMIDRPDGNWYFEESSTIYGFNTVGMPDENSIWYFYKEGEPQIYNTISTTVCHFYQLSPYLDAGYKVEDITAAMDTAWKMLGVTNPPQISFHKDTKVLIAVGEASSIRLIQGVLDQLSTTTKAKSNDKDLPKSKDQ